MTSKLATLQKISGKLTSAINNANRVSPDIPYMTPRDRIVETLEAAQCKVLDAMYDPPAAAREDLCDAFKAVTVSAAKLRQVYGSDLPFRALATWQLGSAAKKIAALISA